MATPLEQMGLDPTYRRVKETRPKINPEKELNDNSVPYAKLNIKGQLTRSDFSLDANATTTEPGVIAYDEDSFTGDAGVLKPKFIAARAYLSTAQLDLTDGVYIKILLDTTSYDTGSNFDTVNHRFTATVAGYYHVIGNIVYSNASVQALKRWILLLYVNGVAIAQSYTQSATTTGIGLNIQDIVHLDIGDYVELYTYVGNGNNGADVVNDTNYTFMVTHLLAKD